MMGATKRGRVPLKDAIASGAAVMKSMALASGRPLQDLTPPWHTEPKPRAPRVESDIPLERDVQKPIIQAIRNHPKVAWLGRMNSGTALAYNADGSKRFTRFHTIAGLSDTLGQLVDGRLCVFEIKRDAKSKLTPDQALFLDLVKVNNGIAACVWTVEMAIAILDAA